ncbi:MAG: hypothetical protein F6K47_40950 [Symploca sp. SIO2E6]|nr:hypothetical protein [Symploca sp. SIO2E6]
MRIGNWELGIGNWELGIGIQKKNLDLLITSYSTALGVLRYCRDTAKNVGWVER